MLSNNKMYLDIEVIIFAQTSYTKCLIMDQNPQSKLMVHFWKLAVDIVWRLYERQCFCLNSTFSHRSAFPSPIEGTINSAKEAMPEHKFQSKS